MLYLWTLLSEIKVIHSFIHSFEYLNITATVAGFKKHTRIMVCSLVHRKQFLALSVLNEPGCRRGSQPHQVDWGRCGDLKASRIGYTHVTPLAQDVDPPSNVKYCKVTSPQVDPKYIFVHTFWGFKWMETLFKHITLRFYHSHLVYHCSKAIKRHYTLKQSCPPRSIIFRPMVDSVIDLWTDHSTIEVLKTGTVISAFLKTTCWFLYSELQRFLKPFHDFILVLSL